MENAIVSTVVGNETGQTLEHGKVFSLQVLNGVQEKKRSATLSRLTDMLLKQQREKQRERGARIP